MRTDVFAGLGLGGTRSLIGVVLYMLTGDGSVDPHEAVSAYSMTTAPASRCIDDDHEWLVRHWLDRDHGREFQRLAAQLGRTRELLRL